MFHYYLEDLASNAILCISDNVFLINNIKSGILDSQRYSISSTYTPTIEKIQNHFNLLSNDQGLRFTPSGLVNFSLDEFPETKQKQELVKLRFPAFQNLLNYAEVARSNNQFGFVPNEEFYIKEALGNQNSINEYANILNISPEFAREELSMIVDSIFLDNFRIFTVCNMWKERINKCTTAEEIDKIKIPMQDTFWIAGIPDV